MSSQVLEYLMKQGRKHTKKKETQYQYKTFLFTKIEIKPSYLQKQYSSP